MKNLCQIVKLTFYRLGEYIISQGNVRTTGHVGCNDSS